MRLLQRRRVVLWMAVLAALAAVASAVQAQTAAPVVVRVAPALAEVGAGDTVDVAIEVVDVEELYGFDVTMTFDPQVVEVVDADPDVSGIQVAQGLFLDPGFAVINAADNSAGSVHLVMTQLNPSLPKSGTGALVVVKLRGRQAGTSSALTVVNPQLARRDGFLIAASAAAGEIRVVAAAGPTRTPLPAQQAGTPMAMMTLEPTVPPATTSQPTSAPTATLVGEPAVDPTSVPSPTSGPATSATTTAVAASPTRPAASPTAASMASPSLAVAALPSLTPGAAATLVAALPGSEKQSTAVSPAASHAPGTPWATIRVLLLAAGAAALALSVFRRHAASR